MRRVKGVYLDRERGLRIEFSGSIIMWITGDERICKGNLSEENVLKKECD